MAMGLLECLAECKPAYEESETPEKLGTDSGTTGLRDTQTWISQAGHYTTKLQ